MAKWWPRWTQSAKIVLHVVAQIVEAEFVVGAVGDVRAVGGAAFGVAQIVDDHADGQSQRAVDRAHPLRVAPRQVIVYGDDVNAAAGERVQKRGKRGDQRFAFAGFHFGDFAFVQHDAADQLHVEVAHAEFAAAHFAHQRKRRHQRGLERLLAALLEFGIVEREIAEAVLYLRRGAASFSPEAGRRSAVSNSGASALMAFTSG